MLVLLVLISIASQNYRVIFSQRALIVSSQQLYKFLGLAKLHAIKYNQTIYVHFCQNGSSQEWRMAQSDLISCDCFEVNSCLVNGVEFNQQLTDGKLVFASIGFNNLLISYSPMRFSVSSGNVTLRDISGQQLKVSQSINRLRICVPDGELFGYKKC